MLDNIISAATSIGDWTLPALGHLGNGVSWIGNRIISSGAGIFSGIICRVFQGATEALINSATSQNTADRLAEQAPRILVGTIENLDKFLENDENKAKLTARLQNIVNALFGNLKTVFDPEQFLAKIGETFNKGNKAFLQGLDISDSVDFIMEEITRATSQARQIWFKEIDGLRKDIQGMISRVARDSVLGIVPWIALGTVVLVGTPLTVYYLFKKAVYKIGTPKLISEIRKTGWLHRVASKVTTLTKFILKETTIVAVVTGATVAAGRYLTLAGYLSRRLVVNAHKGEAQKFFELLQGYSRGYDHSKNGGLPQLYEYLPLVHYLPKSVTDRLPVALVNNLPGGDLFTQEKLPETAIKIAAVTAVGSLACHCFKILRRKKELKAEAIFAPRLAQKVKDIAEATYNLKKSGGFFQNLLLYGPGGTGKTLVAKEIASRSNMDYVMMSGGDLAQFITRGEHVSELNRLFDSIKKPTILFIDEFEGLGKDRGKMDRSQLIELQNAFLSRTGAPSKQLMIIAATNREEDLDEAVISRMDNKLFIGPPAVEERRQILEMYLKQFFSVSERATYFSGTDWVWLIYQTHGLTGRALFKLVNMLAQKQHSMKRGTFTREVIRETVSSFVSQELKHHSTLQRIVRLVELSVTYSLAMLRVIADQTRERLKKQEIA